MSSLTALAARVKYLERVLLPEVAKLTKEDRRRRHKRERRRAAIDARIEKQCRAKWAIVKHNRAMGRPDDYTEPWTKPW